MSCDVEKGTVPESTENDHLLDSCIDVRMTSCSILPEQSDQRHHHHHHHHYNHHYHHRRQGRCQNDNCRSITSYEKSNRNGRSFGIVDGSSHDVIPGTLPSIVVSDVDENDEDPPPYSAIVPPDHVGWPFVFSTHIPYSVHGTQPCITEPPLAPFQIPPPSPSPILLPPPTLALASTSPVQQSSSSSSTSSLQQPPTTTHRLETPSLDRTTPTLSLTPYRFFKFDSHRSIIGHRSSIFIDNVSTGKEVQRRSRKYGGILIAAAVIVFLMVLSLMVRFVMERSFRRR